MSNNSASPTTSPTTSVDQPVTEVTVLIIEHRHGTDAFAFRTEDGARKHLYGYVADWWDNEVNNGLDEADPVPLPEDQDEAISVYFESVDNESYTTERVPVLD